MVSFYGFNDKYNTKLSVIIGYSLTAINLPDGENIIAHDNESTILGESDNSLLF